jgi:hypothetical protein
MTHWSFFFFDKTHIGLGWEKKFSKSYKGDILEVTLTWRRDIFATRVTTYKRDIRGA